MATQLRGAHRLNTIPNSFAKPIMKYIKVTIFTDGMIIKAHNEIPNQKHNYKRVINFPKQLQGDVKKVIIEKQKENIGLITVEVFDTIPIELGGLAM